MSNPSLSLITPLLLGRDTQLMSESSSLQCCCGEGRALSPPPHVQMRPQELEAKGLAQAHRCFKDRPGIGTLVSYLNGNVSEGSEDQRAQGGRWVTWRQDSGRGALRRVLATWCEEFLDSTR